MTAAEGAGGVAPWVLLALFMVPLIGSLIVWMLPRSADDVHAGLARNVTIGLLAVTAALATALWFMVPSGMATFDAPWIEDFGARFRLAATGLSLPLVLLTAFLMLLSVIATDRESITLRAASYYAQILLLTAGILGIFLAADLLVFYLCWELMLVPLYFLIGVWGTGKGPAAGTTFFIYTMVGSLLMLVAIITVASAAGGTTGYGSVSQRATTAERRSWPAPSAHPTLRCSRG